MSPPSPSLPNRTPPVSEPPRLVMDRIERVAVVRFPRSKVDGVAVRELFEAAMTLTDESHPRLVVDLTGVPMVTSGLMGILIQIHKRFLQAGGVIHIAIPDARVRGSFEVANLHKFLYLYDLPEDATRSLS